MRRMTDDAVTLPIPDRAPSPPVGPLYRVVANDWLQSCDRIENGEPVWESGVIRLDQVVGIHVVRYAAGNTLAVMIQGEETSRHLGNVFHGPVLAEDQDPHEVVVALAQEVSAARRRMLGGRA